jgi:hypothetical protein
VFATKETFKTLPTFPFWFVLGDGRFSCGFLHGGGEEGVNGRPRRFNFGREPLA